MRLKWTVMFEKNKKLITPHLAWVCKIVSEVMQTNLNLNYVSQSDNEYKALEP